MIKKLMDGVRQLAKIPWRLDRIQQSLGRIELRQLQLKPTEVPSESEFRVYSQWGEDGIIQFLLSRIIVPNEIFIEFGVENYEESNTRFLLENNNWSGLVLDGSAPNIRSIKRAPSYWRYNLKAECHFITAENIDAIIANTGLHGDIGILSIDVDGNDYWIWKAIECVSPRIVICEYNSLFGPDAAVTIPYDPAFERSSAHYSNLYAGASIAALHHLAREKGYTLICSNSAGNNAFFIRNDLADSFPALSPADAYAKAQFRQSRDKHGNLIYLDFDEEINLIANCVVYDVINKRTLTVQRLAIEDPSL